jgi:hypothetical protein
MGAAFLIKVAADRASAGSFATSKTRRRIRFQPDGRKHCTPLLAVAIPVLRAAMVTLAPLT